MTEVFQWEHIADDITDEEGRTGRGDGERIDDGGWKARSILDSKGDAPFDAERRRPFGSDRWVSRTVKALGLESTIENPVATLA